MRVSSFIALNTGTVTAPARSPSDQIRADAERLSHIVLEMQRCFVLHLCKELAPGNVSFPQFFLLTYLDLKEVLTMSAIAQKMGHTTAAASGLTRAPRQPFFASWTQVTVVAIPPRGVNAPVTLHRRGAHAFTKSSRMRLTTVS